MRTLALAAVVGLAVGCATREDEIAIAPLDGEPAPVVEQAAAEPAAEVPSEPVVPPAAFPVSLVAPASEVASHESDDDSPGIVAYPPPRIESVFVRRSGPEVQLVVRVSRVRGASRYELQVAKTLLFEPLLAETSATTRLLKVGALAPGMFFVHARALGAAGEGPYGDVRVVRAQRSGNARLLAATPDEAFEPTLAGLPPEPETRPPALAAASAPAPTPAQPATPSPALNLGPLHQRYEQLQRELAAVEAVRRDVQTKVVDLQGRLAGAKAKSAASLKADLEALESTRAQLDREIAAGLAELDRMVAASAP